MVFGACAFTPITRGARSLAVDLDKGTPRTRKKLEVLEDSGLGPVELGQVRGPWAREAATAGATGGPRWLGVRPATTAAFPAAFRGFGTWMWRATASACGAVASS